MVAPIATPAARTMGFIEELHCTERQVLVFDGGHRHFPAADGSQRPLISAALPWKVATKNLVFTRPTRGTGRIARLFSGGRL